MTNQEKPKNGEVYSEDIIEILKTQHIVLRNFLKSIADDAKKDSSDLMNISERLRKFNAELANHSYLENCAFYQPLLKKLGGQGFDVEDIKEFIAEMTGLLNTIDDFVKKYKEEAIWKDIATFSADLSVAISELETRIVAEEEGVFIYW